MRVISFIRCTDTLEILNTFDFCYIVNVQELSEKIRSLPTNTIKYFYLK